MKHKFLSPLVIACALAGFSIVAVAADSTTTKMKKTTTNTDGSTVVEETTTTKTAAPSDEQQTKDQQAKDDFKAKMQAKLDAIAAQTKSLKDQASTASSDAKIELDKRIADLDQKRNEINTQLDQASDKTGRAWTRFKAGVQKSVGELQEGYKEAKNEFSKKESRDESDARKAAKENKAKK